MRIVGCAVFIIQTGEDGWGGRSSSFCTRGQQKDRTYIHVYMCIINHPRSTIIVDVYSMVPLPLAVQARHQ